MILAIFGDVHGNLPALERFVQDAGQVDGYVCLGDMVNYGPWSNECVELITALPNVTILEGNHEEYFLNGFYSGINLIAKAFFDFCYPKFTKQNNIKDLKKEYVLNGFTFRHTITDSIYVYPDTKLVLDRNYVIGHSHHQFKIEYPPFILYNPGSVGQNRKYINVIDYIILDSASMKFEFRSLIYNEDLIINEMRLNRYPKICIDYYESKERLNSPSS